MEEETETPQKYLKIWSIAAFLCISQALLLFFVVGSPQHIPHNLFGEISGDLKQPERYIFRSLYDLITNSCHICQESRTTQLSVEGVGRYSVGKVRGGGGLPQVDKDYVRACILQSAGQD